MADCITDSNEEVRGNPEKGIDYIKIVSEYDQEIP